MSGAEAAPTPSQTIGPFFRIGMEWLGAEDLVAPDSRGARRLAGRVLDGDGEPVPDAMIEVWPSDGKGFGRSLTDQDGAFRFTVAKPAAPEGQAPHLEISVFARGLLQRLVTRCYFPDEGDANAADPLLAVVPAERRATLVARDAEGGLAFDIHLQGPEETVFLAW